MDRVIGDAQQDGDFEFDVPIVVLFLLRKSEANYRARESI